MRAVGFVPCIDTVFFKRKSDVQWFMTIKFSVFQFGEYPFWRVSIHFE